MKNKIIVNTIKYNGKLVLNETSFLLMKKGICIINGENGSGKSSIAKQLSNRFHKLIAYMPQDNNNIIEDLDVLSNITFNQFDQSKALQILKTFNLDYIIFNDIKRLSGGEKRIICILRMLLSDADIIILDEPTNDVDKEIQKIIKDLVNYFSQEKFIIIINHRDEFSNYQIKYIIKDKKLILVEDNLSLKLTTLNYNIRNIKDFFVIRRNYILLITNIFFLFILTFSIINFKLERFQSKLEKNIIYLNTYDASNTNDTSNEYLDTSLLGCIKKIDQKKCLETNILSENRKLINNINIKDDYITYVLEYYNQRKNEYYNIINLIEEEFNDGFNYEIEFKQSIEKMLFDNNSLNLVMVPHDTNKTYLEKIRKMNFEIKKYEGEKIILSFNNKFYNEFQKQYQTPNKVSLLIQNPKNQNFYDFIKTNKLDKSILLMRSNDIDKLFYEINQFTSIKTFIKSFIISYIALNMISAVCIFALEKANLNKNKILYNYGYNLKYLINRTYGIYYLQKNLIYYLICIIVISTFAYLKFNNYLIVVSILLLGFVTFTFNKLIKKLIKINMKRVKK